MEAGQKKTLMFVIIIVCIVGAIGITVMRSRGGTNVLKGEMTWMKCRKCNAEYQISFDKYLDDISERRTPNNAFPPLTCEKCGQDGAYRAVKCPKCGVVFEYGSAPNKLPDTCPKCSYSETEASRQR